jgi:hypothetical protein
LTGLPGIREGKGLARVVPNSILDAVLEYHPNLIIDLTVWGERFQEREPFGLDLKFKPVHIEFPLSALQSLILHAHTIIGRKRLPGHLRDGMG